MESLETFNNVAAAPFFNAQLRRVLANPLGSLSDKDLYARCQEYGVNARIWKRRFAGLLPEVSRRELHRRRGHGSIYEFAFKLAGMSSASVDKVLHLAEKLADKPLLREQLLSGSQGWSKIETVAHIATPQTDKDWAGKVKNLSKAALEAYVQVKRREMTKNGEVVEFTPGGELSNNFRTQQWGTFSFPASPEIEKQLRLIKYKLEKEKGVTLTFNEVMQVLLAGGAPQEAQVVIQVCPECAARKAADVESRAIPVGVRRILQAIYKGYCGFPACDRPGTSLHHTKRYSLEKGHDAKSIVPLCKIHERLVHSGLVENEEDPPEKWRVLDDADKNHPKFAIDRLVRDFRKEPIIRL